MSILVITKSVAENIFTVDFTTEDNSSPPQTSLVTKFGDPTFTFGGTFDPTDSDFLTDYFPNAEGLIADWTQFTTYASNDEVQYTDGFYYRALQALDYTGYGTFAVGSDYANVWLSITDYIIGDIVERSGTYYIALQASGSPSVDPTADTSPATWAETSIVKKYSANSKYYKQLQPTEYDMVLAWASGTRYFSSSQAIFGSPSIITADVVLFSSNYYKCIKDSPAVWASGTQYTITDLVNFSGAYYRAIVTAPTLGSSPSAEPASWAVTNGADPITDSGEYWELFTDFTPTLDSGLYWELFTDLDPAIPASTYWVAFVPAGTAPESTTSFSVNQITRGIVSLETTSQSFTFDGRINTEAEANANDFIVIVKKDLDAVWDAFLLNVDSFTGSEDYPLT